MSNVGIYLFKPMNVMSVLLSGLFGIVVCFAMSILQDFLLGIQMFLILLLSLVIVDWITGIMAAHKTAYREAKKKGLESPGRIIKSIKLRQTVEKLIAYFLLLLISQLIIIVFFGWGVGSPLPYIVSAYICYTEYVSIIENVEEITEMRGGGALKKFVKELLNIDGVVEEKKGSE